MTTIKGTLMRKFFEEKRGKMKDFFLVLYKNFDIG